MTDWIFPYPTLFGDVAIRIDRLRVDGEEIPGDRIDSDHREVRLLGLEREGWSNADIEVVLAGPATELQELEQSGTESTAMVVAHCSTSNSRQGVLLSPDGGSATWRGTLELERSSWFGRIDLVGMVTASIDGVAGRVIGEAASWAIRLDDIPPPPPTGAIDIRWQDFRYPEEGLAWLKRYEKEPAFLKLDENQPIMYLNRAFEGLKALLDRKPGRDPGEQALHDGTRAELASVAWEAMFNASVQAIRREDADEDPDWPEEPWKQNALEILLERMYPDKAAADALRFLAERRVEPEDGGALQQSVLAAVHEQVGVARLLRSAINSLGKGLKEVSE